MAAYLPRRLTQLYTDAKHSCDVVSEPEKVENVPELTSLHRKVRIQKDRLIAWGLEWSDETTAVKGSIDESVARAGLTETVTSVLSNIQDVLNEAEKIRLQDETGTAKAEYVARNKPSAPGTEKPWAAADKSRYEDLVKDLTASIDTLYEISRSRRALNKEYIGGGKSSPQEMTLPGPTEDLSNTAHGTVWNAPAPARDNTVNLEDYKIDIGSLILPDEEPPPYDILGTVSSSRMIGWIRRTYSSNNPWKTDGSRVITEPVLIEYAAYDSIFRDTGMFPPTDHLKSLVAALKRAHPEANNELATLPLLGYFEDPKEPRVGLVFALPRSAYSGPSGPGMSTDSLKPTNLFTILRMASKSANPPGTLIHIPNLEDRFRMAYSLARTFMQLHEQGVMHRDVNSGNIIFFRTSTTESVHHHGHSRSIPTQSVRIPVLSSFSPFSEYNVDHNKPASTHNIYCHPDDPQVNHTATKTYGPQHDLYGLGLILLEIGLWVPASEIFKQKYTLAEFKARLEHIWARKLAAKCGTLYMKACLECLTAGDAAASADPNASYTGHENIVRLLQRCCLLDESLPISYPELPRPRVASTVSQQGTMQNLASKTVSTVDKIRRHASTRNRHSSDPRGERSGFLYKSPQSSPHTENPPTPSVASTLSAALIPITAAPSTSLDSSILRLDEIRGELQLKSEALQKLQQDYNTLLSRIDSRQELRRSHSSQASLHTLELVQTNHSSESRSPAADVIQRAWRARKDVISFREYRRKVVIIQNHWRKVRSSRNASRENTITEESQTDHSANDAGAQQAPAQELATSTPLPMSPEAPYFADEAVSERGAPTDAAPDVPAPDYTVRDLHPAIIRPVVQQIPSLAIFPLSLTAYQKENWHNVVLPRTERILGRVLRDSPETVSIDLLGLGYSPATCKPTIVVTCTSVKKVRAVLDRKLNHDRSMYDLKVCRGRIQRSKARRSPRKRAPPHRSMMNEAIMDGNGRAMNPFHQERPLCGASIGAFRGEHLPPVSYGGLVMVDGEPYGMSVHHLLDAPSDEDDEEYEDEPTDRSSALRRSMAPADGQINYTWTQSVAAAPAPAFYPFEFSDDELNSGSDFDAASLSDFGSDFESDFEEEEEEVLSPVSTASTQGDIDGVSPGDGSDILITQPALDDVEDGWFPSEADMDEDHLDSHTLGRVFASSGIRRWNRRGVLHEIDWALFKLEPHRLQPCNLVQGGKRYCPQGSRLSDAPPDLREPVCRTYFDASEDLYPVDIIPCEDLGGLDVHCFGRTSGLQPGQISAVMSSVKIYRRRSFARSWHVIGGFGVGGDSGAWVIDNRNGGVCGHVLAWCARSRIAYICPMQVLIEDMQRALRAQRICLPGGEDALSRRSTGLSQLRGIEGRGDRAAGQDPGLANLLPDIGRLNISDAEAVRSAVTSPVRDLPDIGRLSLETLEGSRKSNVEYVGVV